MSDSNVSGGSQGMVTAFFYIAFIVYFMIIFIYDNDTPEESHRYNWFFLYFLVICEFIYCISLKNENNIVYGISYAAIAVLTTWTMIFLPILIMNNKPVNKMSGLNYAEELNSIFSNVAGYAWVSKEANEILSKLNAADIDGTTSTAENKQNVMSAKILYSEILSNKTLFINQLTPSNYDCQWQNLFRYLFASALNIPETDEEITKIYEKLKSVVYRKNNIGKAFWYLYTSIIAFSLSIFLLSTL